MDTLDSFGNLETIPPYASPTASYPMGRVIRGSTPDFHPDAVTQHMLDSQGYQPVLTLDTSWLWVGHIDETMSFVKMDNPRGWGVALSDPALAKKMLDDLVAQGNGDVPIFQGESVYQGQQLVSAETSAAKILADPDIMSANADAIVEIDAQSQVLRDEVGITDSDIVPVAFLFWNENGYAVAYQVGAVNGVYLSDTDFGAPAPHGPLIGGKDPFETQLEDAMKQHGITVHWIEDWWLYHSNNGEVHCGSNTRRALPATKWWEMGS
jgi:protein-arginine deiminase